MIKFFRKIRQNLLMENKTSKYFKYAIGEIILVVIGILIALWINNKNEILKTEDKIEALLRDIQKDLSEDVLVSHTMFNRYIRSDSLKKKFLKNELESNFRFIFFYKVFPIQSDSYNNLKQNSNSVPKKFLPLLKELNILYGRQKENIEVYNKRIQNTVYNSIDYLSKNKDWFLDWDQGIDNPKITDYYKNDINHRNQIALYMNDLVNLFRDTNEFRIGAIDIYKEIERLLGNKDSIPKHMNYELEDIEKRKTFEGNYKMVKITPKNSKNKDVVFKVAYNNGLKLYIKNNSEETIVPLYWYKGNTFLSVGNIITFDELNNEILLKAETYSSSIVQKKTSND